jgi:uncharacterized protein (TIGR00251 family)
MSPPAGKVWRRAREGLVLTVRLTPKSARDAVEGVESRGDVCVLKTRVRAVPDKGKANAALEKLISKWLRLPASSVSLAGGGKSRLKSVALRGDPDELIGMIEDRLSDLS